MAPIKTDILSVATPRRWLCGIAIGWLALFIYIMFVGHHRGPHYDDWDLLYFVRAVDQKTATWGLLLEQFSGIHRIVIARILFCIEYFAFDGAGHFPNIFFLFVLALSFFVYAKNIHALGTTQSNEISTRQENLLYLTGVLVLFSCTQLFSFNYATTCFQHPASVFLAILCFHLINRDVNSGKPITDKQTATYLALLTGSCLASTTGIFAIASAMAGLIIARAPKKIITITAVFSIIMAMFYIPGNVIYRIADTIYIGSVNDLTSRLNIEKTDMFSGMAHYIFLYFGAPVSAVWKTGGEIFGIGILATAIFFALRYILNWTPRFLFFQMMLYMFLAFGLASTLGRYQLPDNAINGRWYPAFGWTIWTVSFFTLLHTPRIARIIIPVYLVFTVIGSYQSARMEIEKSRNIDMAEINIINHSFIHMTYHVISFQHKVLNFNPPAYFDNYLREKRWGIYKNFSGSGTNLQRNNDTCDAKPIGRWLVSEKQFFEYRLDGWNTTQDRAMREVYALDSDGNIVAYGETISREPEWLPVGWLPREKVQIYMVIPKDYDLTQLTLLGGEDGSFCTIHLN